MAVDVALAERVRELLLGEPLLGERRMFGGLAFLIGGHMAVVVSGRGGLMVRVDPGEADRFVASGAATVVEMRGRPTRGWVRVDADAVRTRRQLERWVDRGVIIARALDPKP